jgi:hypothetical protein
MGRRLARRSSIGRWSVGFAIAACAVPSAAIAITAPPQERGSAEWTPALAAWGARVAAPSGAATPLAPVLRGGAPLAALGPALLSVGQGSADASAQQQKLVLDETQRWVPGFALTSSMVGQKAEGSVDANSTITYEYIVRLNGQSPANANLLVTRSLRESKLNYFDPAGGRPTRLVPGVRTNIGNGVIVPTGGYVLPASGNNLILTPTVGASLELMSPGLQETPGRPRLFVHGDASLAFGTERSFGREGSPEGATFPKQPRFDEVQVKGVGSITEAEMKTLLISGGAGVAFTFDAWERRLRIKPSVEYMREEIEVRGRLIRSFRQNTGSQFPQPITPSVYLPTIELTSDDTLTTYGIGPGLELEMDAARAGPFMLSVFVGGQAYRMLGDRDVNLMDSAMVDVPDDNPSTPATQEVSAKWEFHKHAWSYRGGLGLRFRWLPEGG